MSDLSHNETIKPQGKEDDSKNTQSCANQCEIMWKGSNNSIWGAEAAHQNRLLFLTIPHLSYTIKDHAECDQKSVFISCNDGRHSHSDTCQNQRNSPLRMITQILGFHKKQPPFAEIKVHLHLQQDDSFLQEVLLPPNWIIVQRERLKKSPYPHPEQELITNANLVSALRTACNEIKSLHDDLYVGCDATCAYHHLVNRIEKLLKEAGE